MSGSDIDDDERIDTSGSLCLAFYKKNGRDKRYLFAMLISSTSADGTRNLGDTEVFPHAKAKFRKHFVPTNDICRAEVSRRCAILGIEAPSCKCWNSEKLIAWLKAHPIECLVDREWLLAEEQKIHDLFAKTDKEKKEIDGKSKDWGENNPWLRLCCAFYDDSVRELFLAKDDAMDRQELDARNNESRPPTIWEALAELFNDPDREFDIPPMPELHQFFAQPIKLRFEDVPGAITADVAKSRMAEARARLMKVISKWELSGNGFGQRVETDEDFGRVEEEQLMDGDNRARFLDGIGREHLLLLWDLGDKLGLLPSVLNQLSSDVAIDCDNIHTDTSDAQNKRKLTDDQMQAKAFRESLASSMETISHSSLCQQLRESEDKIIKLKEQTWRATTDGALEFYESCLAVEMERAEELRKELKRVKRLRTEQISYSV